VFDSGKEVIIYKLLFLPLCCGIIYCLLALLLVFSYAYTLKEGFYWGGPEIENKWNSGY
jgi:hypothetical protein